MAFPSPLKALVAVVVVMATLATGVVVVNAVTSTTTKTTYYACLSGGTLSKVATTPPTCTAPATSISWNSVGPAGAAGKSVLSGVGAPSPNLGAIGDFYIDTSSYIIYGPSTKVCNPKCELYWGTGTSLKGQGFVYDTQLAGPVLDPGGASNRVLTQTLASGGDFVVTARMVGIISNDEGEVNPVYIDTDWNCALVAANPGGSTITLDTDQEYGASPTTLVELQGEVSLAPGGFVGINCDETTALNYDFFSDARITSTQVGGFTSVAPG